eukprot:SAG31_NODE_1143_length_9694_cov_5.541011_4_plen_170_part_00
MLAAATTHQSDVNVSEIKQRSGPPVNFSTAVDHATMSQTEHIAVIRDHCLHATTVVFARIHDCFHSFLRDYAPNSRPMRESAREGCCRYNDSAHQNALNDRQPSGGVSASPLSSASTVASPVTTSISTSIPPARLAAAWLAQRPNRPFANSMLVEVTTGTVGRLPRAMV